MPIPLQYKLPMTNNSDEFEDMVEDYFKVNYRFAQRYGRKGQKQYGIDVIVVYNNIDDSQSYIAVQCKNYSPTEQELDNIINQAVAGTMQLAFPFSKIVIALGTQRDTKIQNFIMKKNSSNILVEPLFWEQISSTIASNNELLNRYYPQMDFNTATIEKLVEEFNKGIRECHIVEVMRNDPLSGMPSSYSLDMDIFCIEMEKQLIATILLQKENIYQNIQEFSNLIEYYNSYLSTRMNPAGTNYYSVAPFISYDEMRNEILQIKAQLNESYQVINSGCSIL